MLENYDMTQFRKYAERCADLRDSGFNMRCDDPNYILRFWQENKEKYLYDLLGQELIVSKDVVYERDKADLIDDMHNVIARFYSFSCKLLERLKDVTNPKWTHVTWGRPQNNAAEFYDVVKKMLSADSLVEGRVPESATCVVMGKEIQLSAGQKSMRAIGRLAQLLDLTGDFEDFRIAHSQALNQKTVRGTLHLSIHPLDYATASDNANGWSSCMSWQEGGCYRLGTVEMMNSPMVLCAYLTGNNTLYDVGGQPWNSKKWRSWVIVTPDVILVNRHYPFHSVSIAHEIVDWVKSLAQTNLDWQYQETEDVLEYGDFGFSFRTNFMYNDVGGDHAGAVGISCEKIEPSNWRYNEDKMIVFSGEAVCMWCGAEIEYDGNDEDANTLCCERCRDGHICLCCGQHLHEDDVFWSPMDEPYCQDCYYDRWTCCECCDETVSTEEIMSLDIGIDTELLKTLVSAESKDSAAYRTYFSGGGIFDGFYANDARHVTLCDHCLNNYGADNAIIEVKMPYDHYKGYWSNSYQTVMTINPLEVSFENANYIFNFYAPWRDTDGSLARVWKKMWEAHIARMIDFGEIEI